MLYPICIGGENACPPEDCGGIGGNDAMMQMYADKNHECHEEIKTWLGGYFDMRTFDPNRINRDILWMKKW